ncbi:hypothetical protein pb186bvf_000016 [Paramecium bursaria]
MNKDDTIQLSKVQDAKIQKAPKEVQSEEQKQQNYEQFKRFIDQSGISDSFQVVFAEIIDRKIKEDDAYKYAADRLREIGKGLSIEQTRAKQEIQKKEATKKKQ